MVFNKDVTFCPLSDVSKEVSVKIVQKYPLPLNILSFLVITSALGNAL